MQSAEITVPAPEQAVLEPCAGPVLLPDRALEDLETEAFWRRDRIRLVDCRDKHKILAAYATAVQAEITKRVP